jgi:hypothetical protein
MVNKGKPHHSFMYTLYFEIVMKVKDLKAQ